MRLKLPLHVHGFTDRHGKPRYYLRRPGFKAVALPGVPWTPEFMAAYEAAMTGDGRPALGAGRTIPGTINALVVAYFNSAEFHALSKTTQATYRGIIEAFKVEHGDKRVATLDRKGVSLVIARKASTPAAATNLLRMIRLLMRFAMDNGLRSDDPTVGLKAPKMNVGGFYSWSEDDIAKFEAAHPVGTRARLAFDLLLWTGQRRGDVVSMGRQHVREGCLSIRQQKTGTLVEVPVHARLAASIEAMPNNHLTFLVTEGGAPFTAAGFGNWFREVCDDAGVPKECSAHGLRKAFSVRMAEAGCNAHEIMSWTGHRTLKEVTRYTAAVDRKKLARTAMDRLNKQHPFANLPKKFAK